MSLNDILKIALTIIGCFGGVGAIVSATVKFTSEKIAVVLCQDLVQVKMRNFSPF